MANSSTKAGTKYPTRETTPDVAAPQVVGPIMDKASNNNVPKHPSRQGSSQIAAQLILKEPRTSNNKTSLEIKSNDASSKISNSLLSECSSESNRKAAEITNTKKARYGKIMEQVAQHKSTMHGANARRERSSDLLFINPSGEGEVTAKMTEPNPEAENKREKIEKEETKQVMNHNQKDDDDLPIAQEDINASGKELAKKHHLFTDYLDDVRVSESPDHELQQLEITLSRKSKPNLTTNNNTRAPTTPAQLLSFKAVHEQEQNQSK